MCNSAVKKMSPAFKKVTNTVIWVIIIQSVCVRTFPRNNSSEKSSELLKSYRFLL